MKKLLLLPYAALALVFTLGSCSMEKRVYRNGYHIEWNQANNNSVKQEAAAPETAVAETTPAETVTPVPSEEPVSPAVGENNVTDQTASAPVCPEEKTVTAPKKKGLISRIIKDDSPEDLERIQNGSKAASFKSGFKQGLKMMMPDQEAHTLHLAIASFVLGLVSLVAYYGAFVLGLLAIIFGAVAIHKIRASGGMYRGNTFAWIGLICGIVAIALAVVIIRVY